MDAQHLIQHASHVLQKEHVKKIQTGYYYNIFRVTNMYDDEVKICRVLHDLLNPAGQHYQGTLFLKAFVDCLYTKKAFSPKG